MADQEFEDRPAPAIHPIKEVIKEEVEDGSSE